METNMLRFPMFYLAKKGRNTVDAIQVKGTRDIDGQTIEFLFRVSRNTDHPFPGMLSRDIHAALLRMLFDTHKGPPFSNIIPFGWRELARYRGISYDGSSRDEWKMAIRSTKSANIHTKNALISAETGKPLMTRERDLSLYEEVAFIGDIFEGRLSDRNFVRLAPWFIANLNYNYATYLDHEYWLHLNTKNEETKLGGPTASRLLEYFTFLFHSGFKEYTINYSTLCAYLPVPQYSCLSRAKQQLSHHLTLLRTPSPLPDGARQALSSFEWSVKEKQIQLKIIAGPDYWDGAVAGEGTDAHSVSTTEEHSDIAPSEFLVRNFLREFGFRRPSAQGERLFAATLLENHGRAYVEEALRNTGFALLREKFPAIRTFNGIGFHWDDILKKHGAKVRQEEKRKADNEKAAMKMAQEAAENAKYAEQRRQWFTLPKSRRATIRQRVIDNAHPRLKRIYDECTIDNPARTYLAEMDNDGVE